MSVREPRSRARFVVAVPVLFNLWALRTETSAVPNLNDGTVHTAMIRWAGRAFASGQIPLDGWFPYLTNGFPWFHHYQSAPSLISGVAARFIDGDIVYTWSLYLLLASWPVSVYIGTRLMGWEPHASAAAAFVAPLATSFPGYGYEFGSYVWAGLGVWTQLWGMWLLPLCWGLTWRAVHERRGYLAAGVSLAATMAFHFLTGYFALLCLGVWVIAARPGFLGRLRRGAGVAIAAMLLSAWSFVPALADLPYTAKGEYLVGFWRDSHGAPKVLGWLFSGRLFDWARPAVLTAFVFVGLIVCLKRFRSDVRSRALLGVFALSFVLFSGRPTFGFVLQFLPGASDLLLSRYVIGLHLSGMMLAGVGVAAVGRAAARLFRRSPRAAVAAMLAVFAVLVPAFLERARYAAFAARLVRGQELAERLDAGALDSLIRSASRRGSGRIFAGLPATWGGTYRVGEVPVFASLLNQDAYGFGFTFRVPSLLSDVEARFDDKDRRLYDVFNVEFILTPRGQSPPVGAEFVESAGDHSLWRLDTGGDVMLVDTIGPIAADRLYFGRPMWDFLHSEEFFAGRYPTVSLDGRPAGTPTLAGPAGGRPGRVVSQRARPERGVFTARVRAERTSAVVLKASFHPRWRIAVDGKPFRPYLVAPGFVGVTVGPGPHVVEFRYIPYGGYPLFVPPLLFALLALLEADGRLRFVFFRSRPKQRELADDGGDRLVLPAQPDALHADEKEQQEEAGVEREVDAASDAEPPGQPHRGAGEHDGRDERGR